MPTKAEYAKIHIAKKALSLGDDEYRDILQQRFGARSSTKLTSSQVGQLLDHFRRQGVKFTPPGRRGANFKKIKPGEAANQQRYILAMWNALGYDVKAIDARVKKQFKVERLEWLLDGHDLHVFITDLQARCRRAGLDPDPR